jgi:hypothetical protein
VTSTSTSNRAQGKYCVGCRTRQKKKNPDSKKSQRDPPPHLLSLCAFGGARRARRCYLSRKRVRITPTGGAVGDAFTQRRQEQYRRRIAAGDTSLRFVAEGDSWFHYPIVLRDTLDWLSDSYAIFDLAAAGDTPENMKRGISNIIDVIEREGSQGFLLSGEGTTCWKVTD